MLQKNVNEKRKKCKDEQVKNVKKSYTNRSEKIKTGENFLNR